MIWPHTIEVAIDTIEKADFLTQEQKRDIFYNNAARFLRLTPQQIADYLAALDAAGGFASFGALNAFFVDYFAFPSLMAGALYEGKYPLATALGR